MNATTKKWQAAKFDGRDVHCYVPVRVVFKPQTADCKTTADNFDAAYTLTYEGEQLYAEAKPEEGIAAPNDNEGE